MNLPSQMNEILFHGRLQDVDLAFLVLYVRLIISQLQNQ